MAMAFLTQYKRFYNVFDALKLDNRDFETGWVILWEKAQVVFHVGLRFV